jgi:Ras-related protein Rab-5C
MIHKKMIIVGNTNVGKTSIMERFVSDTFEEMLQPTYQASQRAKIIQPPECKDKIKLNIWDTAG